MARSNFDNTRVKAKHIAIDAAEKIFNSAYECGKEDTLKYMNIDKIRKEAYEKGCRDAWLVAQTICSSMPRRTLEDLGFKVKKPLASDGEYYYSAMVIEQYSVEEAMDKIKKPVTVGNTIYCKGCIYAPFCSSQDIDFESSDDGESCKIYENLINASKNFKVVYKDGKEMPPRL